MDECQSPSREKRWLRYFSEEARKANVPEKTIYSCLREKNAGFEKNIALNYFGNRIRYGRLFEEIEYAAGAFSRLGIQAGDTVVCCSVTIPEAVYTLYALNKLGATALMLDPNTKPVQIKKFMADTNARVLLILDLFYESVKPLLDDPAIDRIIVISPDASMPGWMRLLKNLKMPAPKLSYTDRLIPWKSFSASGRGVETRTAAYGENPVAAITFTGGSTGEPKGVMLSNEGFNAISLDFAYCGVPYTRDQRFLNVIPMCASYGICSALNMPLTLGLEVVVLPVLSPEKAVEYIRRYKPAHTLLVPSCYEALMNSKRIGKHFDLSFLKTAGSGGDTMTEAFEAKVNSFLREHGCEYPISQGYGMSEVSSAASCCCAGNFRSLSVGYPLLTSTVGIFRPGTTEELGYGEEGEICISGPTVMLGYVNNPGETAHTLIRHPDGELWVHSGDLGVMDEDGFLFIRGRIKRMITHFKGHKLYPNKIESTINEHPDVDMCAVFGARDREHGQGQIAVAVILLHEGAQERREAVQKELVESCKNKLAWYDIPEEIIFADSMPLTGMGKIDYLKLAGDYEKEKDRLAVKM